MAYKSLGPSEDTHLVLLKANLHRLEWHELQREHQDHPVAPRKKQNLAINSFVGQQHPEARRDQYAHGLWHQEQ